MRRTQHRRSFATLIAAAAVVLILAACGAASASAPVPTAHTLQSKFVSTVKTVSPSVVEVRTPAGLGSGVVIDGEGDIVTNNHVVGTYKKFTVSDSTGKTYRATLVGTFVPDDLAVIRVAGAHLKPLPLGDSSRLEVGDIVLAVGNPLGLQSSVTQGIVSALGRTVTEQTGSALADVIQTSAAINPGNSGGALVDLEGRVVGIPTLAAVDPENSQLASGIGFAIPSNTVKAIAGQLVRYGHVVNSGRAFLGIGLMTTLSGRVAVASVTAKGPAALAGIVAGDTITAIAGRPVASVDDVAAILANLHPGQSAKVAVRTPAGKSETRTVKLGQYPGN